MGTKEPSPKEFESTRPERAYSDLRLFKGKPGKFDMAR